ncbi:DapH/DapD/GlmU-related protein [Vibrio vulnificus]
MKKFLRIISNIYHHIHCRKSPYDYAKGLGVKLGENVNFYGLKPGQFGAEPWLIEIGNNVYITAGCQFITHDGGTLILRKEVPDLELCDQIKIGNDVYIGMNTMICPGVVIGDRVIIGAGSIVTKSIPSNSVAVGSPARVIKTVDEYLEKAKINSIKLGDLYGKEKEIALKKHFNVFNDN